MMRSSSRPTGWRRLRWGAALLALLLVGGLGTLAWAEVSHILPAYAGVPTSVITNHWTNLFPTLNSVSAPSSSEAWAVGEFGHLMHFAGGRWTALDPPAWRGWNLSEVRMLSAADGWIAAGPHALEYDGASWNERSAGLGPDLQILHLAPVGRSNVWGVGLQGDNYAVLHWNGTLWSVAGPPVAASQVLVGIAMVGSHEGWVVGSDYVNYQFVPLLFHYDGSTWARITAPGDAYTFTSVAAAGPDDVWLTAEDGPPIRRYTGGVWTSLAAPCLASRVMMLSPTDGWAGGAYQCLQHWDGTSWTVAYTGRPLTDIGGVAGQIWAVGWTDTILGRSGGGQWQLQQGGPTSPIYEASPAGDAVAALSDGDVWRLSDHRLLHLQQGTWMEVPYGGGNLYDLQMLSPTSGYAVGDRVIAHWDGVTWSTVATPATRLNALHVSGPSNGWAVGEGGAIWRLSGAGWAQAPSPVQCALHGIAMDSPTHGWAVGGWVVPPACSGPIALEYVNGSWVNRTANLPPVAPSFLWDVVLTGPQEGWAVGEDTENERPILRLHGGVWTSDPLSGTSNLEKLARGVGAEIWAAGIDGVYHYTGSRWESAQVPAMERLHAIGTLLNGRGWAVGDAGTILRYDAPGLPPVPGTPTATPTPCPDLFCDVHPTDYFYTPVQYLVAHGVISGYADHTFRPYSTTTRAQLVKIVVLGFALPIQTPAGGAYTFSDVPPTQPFFAMIETAAADAIVSGYGCGGLGEPCDAQQRPYFRPYAYVTRGQLSKITVTAANWPLLNPAHPTFADVAPGSAFYQFVETAACHGVISGYTDGTFRPGANATRGQIAKIGYLAITGGAACATPTAVAPSFTPVVGTATSMPSATQTVPSATPTETAGVESTATATAPPTASTTALSGRPR